GVREGKGRHAAAALPGDHGEHPARREQDRPRRPGREADSALPAARAARARATGSSQDGGACSGEGPMTIDRRWLAVVPALAMIVGVWNFALFTVPQWMQAMVVQLGEPVRIVREPGLYWKIPFIQQVTY